MKNHQIWQKFIANFVQFWCSSAHFLGTQKPNFPILFYFLQIVLQVWAIAKDGSVFLRHGITDVAPTGQIWIQAHPPGYGIGSGLKSVTGGDQSLWALDHNGKVWYRQEITPVFPEGTSWSSVANMSSSPNAFTGG